MELKFVANGAENVRGQASLLHQPCHYIVGGDLEG